MYSTYGINIAQCVIQHADSGRETDGDTERDYGLVGVLAAMEDIGQVEEGYVHGIPE